MAGDDNGGDVAGVDESKLDRVLEADFELIVKPFAGENPYGEDVTYGERLDAITEEIWKLTAASSRESSIDWEKVKRLCVEVLTRESKDLRVACYLTVALFQLHGYPGARFGLDIVFSFVADHWEGVFPPVEKRKRRANDLRFLNDRLTPLIEQKVPSRDDHDYLLAMVDTAYSLECLARDLLREQDFGIHQLLGAIRSRTDFAKSLVVEEIEEECLLGDLIEIVDLVDTCREPTRTQRRSFQEEEPPSRVNILFKQEHRDCDEISADPQPVAQNSQPCARPAQFAVYLPSSVALGSTFVLDVWAFESSEFDAVKERAQMLGREKLVGVGGGKSISLETALMVRVQVDRILISRPSALIHWNGEIANVNFVAKVPVDTFAGKHLGSATVAYNGITVARINFLVDVQHVKIQGEFVDTSTSTVYPKTAFASYASEDREEVLARLQGMTKVVPDLDIFLDVESIRSGDDWKATLEQHVPSKDTFYLFWSRFARNSEWVEREWRLALAKRGLEYIDPVPLDEPDLTSPPRELQSLHFNDAYMRHLQFERAKKELSRQKTEQ